MRSAPPLVRGIHLKDSHDHTPDRIGPGRSADLWYSVRGRGVGAAGCARYFARN